MELCDVTERVWLCCGAANSEFHRDHGGLGSLPAAGRGTSTSNIPPWRGRGTQPPCPGCCPHCKVPPLRLKGQSGGSFSAGDGQKRPQGCVGFLGCPERALVGPSQARGCALLLCPCHSREVTRPEGTIPSLPPSQSGPRLQGAAEPSLTQVALSLLLQGRDRTVLVGQQQLLQLGHLVPQQRHLILRGQTDEPVTHSSPTLTLPALQTPNPRSPWPRNIQPSSWVLGILGRGSSAWLWSLSFS